MVRLKQELFIDLVRLKHKLFINLVRLKQELFIAMVIESVSNRNPFAFVTGLVYRSKQFGGFCLPKSKQHR